MQDIVVPDVDETGSDDDAVELPDVGADGAAVAALVASLRLRDPDMQGCGALIVRWCDDGTHIELRIEALPADAPTASDAEAGFAPAGDADPGPASDGDPRDEDPSSGAVRVEEMELDEAPPRPRCVSRTVASSRLVRRRRR